MRRRWLGLRRSLSRARRSGLLVRCRACGRRPRIDGQPQPVDQRIHRVALESSACQAKPLYSVAPMARDVCFARDEEWGYRSLEQPAKCRRAHHLLQSRSVVRQARRLDQEHVSLVRAHEIEDPIGVERDELRLLPAHRAGAVASDGELVQKLALRIASPNGSHAISRSERRRARFAAKRRAPPR